MNEVINMLLNGKDVFSYNITPTKGTLKALQQPAKYKKTIMNENAAMHGTRIVTTPSKRRKDKRTVIIPFVCEMGSLYELEQAKDRLEALLVAGRDNSGINELYVPNLGKCYRLWFEDIEKYDNFGTSGMATFQIKFTEPDPTNVSIPSYIAQ